MVARSPNHSSEKILIVDFGSQTTHLIARRLRDIGAQSLIVTPEVAVSFLEKENVAGIILSGGPSSVYEEGAPTIAKEIFAFDVPMLTICYGMQLTSHVLGGKVVSGRKEYGPAVLTIKNEASPILNGLPETSTVWMSHGDEVLSMPENFVVLGSTEHVPYAFVADDIRKYYGLQFHPEVEHTEIGIQILKNFLEICRVTLTPHKIDPEAMIRRIQEIVEDKHVIGAVSGGVDSTVAGVLVAKAIGNRFTPIFVDNGLMRPDATGTLEEVFAPYGVKPVIVNVEQEMLEKLQGATDSEHKRKIIGNFYIEVFERELQKLASKDKDITFLLQGTIYSDVIESQGTKHAAKIKSHHNVGGLPEHMKLQLLEPIRELYKDEVRKLGSLLSLSQEVVNKQPFPGPGYAVRIRGEVTKERLAKEKIADRIVLEELEKSGWLGNVFLSFPVMTGAYSTAVKGDGRSFDEVIALRIIESKDIMTTTWSRLPYDLLQKISSRIVNEVPHISRVVYDITTKPPATMEWE